MPSIPVSPRVEDMPLNEWCSRFEEKITACLKLLLETKHLYQSATLETKDLVTDLKELPVHDILLLRIGEAAKHAWLTPGQLPFPLDPYNMTLKVSAVKLFCDGECQRVEAFNPIATQDFTGRGDYAKIGKAPEANIQVFALSLLCQSCKGVPEVFLVRRQGLKLTLCGRAPIEHVQVPPVIPKSVREYYSGAMVAHQSGQTLAGLFLLRTLVEQWARSQVEKPWPPTADKLMDKYMAPLPDDFKSRFPSLRKVYDDISADIHVATGSANLFDSAAADIERHFDARRLLKIVEVKPAPTD